MQSNARAKVFKTVTVLTTGLFITVPAFRLHKLIAQQITFPQSKLTNSRFSKINFRQDLNIFLWDYFINYHKQFNKLNLTLSENFSSTLQRVAAQDLWKDNQNFLLTVETPLRKNLNLRSQFFSHMLSDPLAGFDNDVTLNRGSLQLIYQPLENIQIAPQIGYKWQTQVEKSDQGFSFAWNTRVDALDIVGYRNDFDFQAQEDFFPQRRNEDLKIHYQLNRAFYKNTADTLIFFINRLRRDSFDADAGGIFVRNLVQTDQGVENRLSYQLSEHATLYLRNAVSSNTFRVNNFRDQDTDLRKDDKGFESTHTLYLMIQKARWTGKIGWKFRARSLNDRRPREKIVDPFQTRFPSLGFDTDDKLVELNLQGGLRIGRRDSMGLFTSISKFQYDTTDEINPNSHDQQRWHFNFSHAHIFSSDLRLVWRASAFLNHFVFISGKFSSGNNWERIFQLSPTIYYQLSSNFKTTQSFIVRAKYQTYDFDDPVLSNRNNVNRQFILKNSSSIRLTARTLMELDFNLELAEQGKLFYKLWRQSLALSWQNQEIKVLFRHKIGRHFEFSPGGNFFQQLRWDHRLQPNGNFVKKIRDKHTNLGPVLQMSYRPSSNLEFVFLGNSQIVYSTRRPKEVINNFDVNLNWFF